MGKSCSQMQFVDDRRSQYPERETVVWGGSRRRGVRLVSDLHDICITLSTWCARARLPTLSAGFIDAVEFQLISPLQPTDETKRENPFISISSHIGNAHRSRFLYSLRCRQMNLCPIDNSPNRRRLYFRRLFG